MSRSVRKTLKFAITAARSEREDKKLWHGRARAIGRVVPQQSMESILPLDRREVSSPWTMAKDGKRWLGNLDRQARFEARLRGISVERAKHKLMGK